MKTIVKRTTATLLFAIVMTMGLMAQSQNNGNKGCANIPDLTEEQKTELKALRMEQAKASETYRNQIGEIRARQRTLMSAADLDEKAIGKLIDEKTSLMNKHLKEGVAHKAAVKEILTEEQQVYMKQMQKRRQQFARQGAKRGHQFAQSKGMRDGTGRGAPGRGPGNNQNFRGQNR